MDINNLLLAALAIAVGSVVQRASGVGGGFIFVPVLAMIDVSFVPGPIVMASMSLSTLMAIRDRQHIDHSAVPVILAGFIPGALIGAWILSAVAADRLGVVFGTVILVAVLISSLGLHPPLNRVTRMSIGAVSGVMGSSSGIGAPPLALLYHRESGAVLRGTLALLYTLCSALILMALAVFADFSADDALTGLLLTPGFIIGYLLGAPFVRMVDAAGVKWVVLMISAAAALALIVKSF